MHYHLDVLLSADSMEDKRKAASTGYAVIDATYEMVLGGEGSLEERRRIGQVGTVVSCHIGEHGLLLRLGW